jgi:hypothetical protein
MIKTCPSCHIKYHTQFENYELAKIFGDLQEKEYWLSGLCEKCQNEIFIAQLNCFLIF